MKTKEYPELGAKVKYLRADENGKMFEGKGNVQAIFLDPNKRVMVQVLDRSADQDQVFNVDLMGIDYTGKTKVAYKKLIEAVQAKTQEGNEKAREIVKQYNDEVDALYSAELGAPVVLEE